MYLAARDQYIYNRPPPAPAAASNTLPRDTAGFTGRERELRLLLDHVSREADKSRVIPVHAIDGMPGIGKTALAIHAAHLLAHRFPDGQFFINLHAHTAGQGPVRPTDALHALLSADGVRAAQVPADIDARAAQWRGRMAGRKAVLILDNAAGRRQVEHLLPGAPGCLVLITSRRRLTGLSASHAPVAMPLDTLPAECAVALFAKMADRTVAGSEAEAAEELVRLCGYLPLAICLLAAKLLPEPRWRIADMVKELSQAKYRLAQMCAEDLAVAAAFDMSYNRLSTRQRRFFRRLGLHPGTDLDKYAAAALDGVSPAKAQHQLDALYHDHLLDQPVKGRYRMHDLISVYASSRADNDPAVGRAQAAARLVDYYGHGAHAADQYLSRLRGQRAERTRGSPVVLPDIYTYQQALAWMDVERANLFACATGLCTGTEDRRLIALAGAMAIYLRHAGPWDHAVSLHRAAAAAARKAGEKHAEADAIRELGIVLRLTGEYKSAEHTLRQALEIYESCGHDGGIAETLTHLGGVKWRAGDYPGAAQDLRKAFALYQSRSDLIGQADALDELGVVHIYTNDHHAAIKILRQALSIHRDTGDQRGQANALNQLGGALALIGRYPMAIQAHQQALTICQDLGDRYGHARVLNYLGVVRCLTGDYSAAEQALTEALTVHRDLGYRPGQANALNYLGAVHCQTGDLSAADRELTQALALYRELGQKAGQADALNKFGVLHRLAGDYGGADDQHQRALAIFIELGDQLGQAETLNNLGQLFLVRDQPKRALERHQEALAAAHHAHSPREEALALEGIGRCAMRLGNHEEAAQKLRQAHAIYERIGAPHEARAVAEVIEEAQTKRRS